MGLDLTRLNPMLLGWASQLILSPGRMGSCVQVLNHWSSYVSQLLLIDYMSIILQELRHLNVGNFIGK